jgi:hypothetical protein
VRGRYRVKSKRSAPFSVAALLTKSIVLTLVVLGGAAAHAEPIRVTGQIFIDSAGGDFPDFNGPINELIYFLAGPGLPAASGEVLETIPALGTRGGLEITRSATPQPLVAGVSHSLTTRATFVLGRAFEPDFLAGGRAYDIAGDFQFTGGPAVLESVPFDELVGQAPFTFDGFLRAFDIDTGALLFSHSLHGRGIGEVTFSPANPAFFQYRYSLDPVPEPGTLMLLGGALSVLAARHRRRFTRHRPRSGSA